MSTEMTIVLAILYFVFWVWGSSRKAQVSATPSQTDCNYINYFPESEPEEEELIKDPSSSEDWSNFSDQEFISALGEMIVPEVAVAVIDDPWEQVDVTPIEFEFNKCQLEYQLALPPAQDVIEEDPESECAESALNYEIAQYHLMLSLMSIRQLKAEAKKVKLPKYGNMKKAELLAALKQHTA